MHVAPVVPIKPNVHELASRAAEGALTAGGLCVFRSGAPNMDRAYWLLVQPNLFGGWDLIRVWGRRGHWQQRPRHKVEHYADREGLRAGLEAAVRERVRGGYRLPTPRPQKPRRPARTSRAWRRCYGLPVAEVAG